MTVPNKHISWYHSMIVHVLQLSALLHALQPASAADTHTERLTSSIAEFINSSSIVHVLRMIS